MSIHLNDNGIITMDEDFLNDVLYNFDLTIDDLPYIRRNNL